jgi:hypothetical protein
MARRRGEAAEAARSAVDDAAIEALLDTAREMRAESDREEALRALSTIWGVLPPDDETWRAVNAAIGGKIETSDFRQHLPIVLVDTANSVIQFLAFIADAARDYAEHGVLTYATDLELKDTPTHSPTTRGAGTSTAAAAMRDSSNEVQRSELKWLLSIRGGAFGPVAARLRETLLGTEHGTAPDPHGWLHRVL